MNKIVEKTEESSSSYDESAVDSTAVEAVDTAAAAVDTAAYSGN